MFPAFSGTKLIDNRNFCPMWIANSTLLVKCLCGLQAGDHCNLDLEAASRFYDQWHPAIFIKMNCYIRMQLDWTGHRDTRMDQRGGARQAWSTHWGQDKIDAIVQTTFSNSFFCLKIVLFWFKFVHSGISCWALPGDRSSYQSHTGNQTVPKFLHRNPDCKHFMPQVTSSIWLDTLLHSGEHAEWMHEWWFEMLQTIGDTVMWLCLWVQTGQPRTGISLSVISLGEQRTWLHLIGNPTIRGTRSIWTHQCWVN